jgi:hypothetical protein
MAINQLANLIGAHQSVSDFRTFKTADGELIKSGVEEYVFVQANAAIARGNVVSWVVPTATTPLRVANTATTDDSRLIVGIAEQAATAAGQVIRVCRKGITEVDVAAQTAAFGDRLSPPSTTAGKGITSTTDPDATSVVGTGLGTTLAAKDANNFAPVFLERV